MKTKKDNICLIIHNNNKEKHLLVQTSSKVKLIFKLEVKDAQMKFLDQLYYTTTLDYTDLNRKYHVYIR